MNVTETGKGWLKRNRAIVLISVIAAIAVAIAIKMFVSNFKTQGKNEELTTQLSTATAQLEATTNELESTKTKLKKTEDDLSAAKDQVELLEDTTAALNRQVTGLNSTKKALESRIKKLLDVQDAKPKITRDQLEEQITAIGDLTTLTYFYTNSSRKTGNLTWLWGWTVPFSDSSLLVTYDGTIKAGITLSQIKFDVTEDSRTIKVILPKSRILDNYIPQETINVLEVKDGLFNPVTFDDYNKFITEEKKVMEKRATDTGILTEADKNARTVVETFLKGIPGMDTYKLTFK